MPELHRRGGIRILVVDNNVDAANTFSLLLDLEGYWTTTAYNGADAVSAARRASFDAVLLELNMPFMSGFEVAAMLNRMQNPPTLIASSAPPDAETRRVTASLGFAAHLSKPFPIEVFLETLARHCAAEPR